MRQIRLHTYPPAEPEALVYEGKFVQLMMRGQETLVFAPKSLHRFHNEILDQFFAENGVSHHWRDGQTLVHDTDAATVIGGGRFKVDTVARHLALYDNSQAYGRFREDGLAQKIAAADHPWQRYKVEIS